MSDTILSGKLTVYYKDDNRRKQIRWTGTAAKDDVQKMIDVYDACEDLLTRAPQQDDGLIFSAETPGEYTIGKIDAGEIDPWFIDIKTMTHIIGDYANFTGCALKTSGWTRVQDSNTGIVVVAVSSGGTIVEGDIGNGITHGDGDSGTLLDVIITGGSTDYLFIRPDSSASTNNFDSTTGTLTEDGSSHTATQSAAAVTGEMIWGNVYTQGALVTDTHVFMYQNGERVVREDSSTDDWWVDGHVDRAVPITDYTQSGFPVIDDGYLTVKANQYGSKYSYAIIRMNTTSGGNVSAGLSSGNDLANDTGYASVTLATASGNWNVGDEIEGQTTGARAIITDVVGSNPTPTLHFYYIGDPLTAFNGSEAIDNNDDTGTSSGSGAVSDEGPADSTWFDGAAVPTYTFANAQADIDDDGSDEEYGITIDLNQCSLAQMHQYNKYAQRRGSTLDHDGLDGQEWIGIDYAVNYATITGTVSEGATVTGVTSGATGVVVSNPGGTSNTALLRNTRGTFVDGEQIQVDTSNYFAASGLTVEEIVPVAESSFGTLAGTNFFASRGVLLSDYKTTEANLFSLIDATGTPRARPTLITLSIGNLLQYDYATMWRLTGAAGSRVIDKTEYSATGGEVVGDTTITVDGTIAADVPDKDNGGTLVLRDDDDNGKEYVIRFSSYVPATGVVTLANIDIAAADAGTDEDTIVESGAFTNAKVGDIVVNKTRSNSVSYVTEVVSANEVSISPAITGQTTGDAIELNCVPITISTDDDVYFALVWEFRESDGTATASCQYVSGFYARARVRNTSDAAIKIKGYTSSDIEITTGGGSATATRIENTVYGS
jgi:hypothetical protein